MNVDVAGDTFEGVYDGVSNFFAKTQKVLDDALDSIEGNPYMFRVEFMDQLKKGFQDGVVSNNKVILCPAEGLSDHFQMQMNGQSMFPQPQTQ